ncbi:MAG: hypothetical protein GY896_19365 [Gammaproteobacteria bacterium]|nr:hypothetical protein [Gammaproteobacteria bacterium]
MKSPDKANKQAGFFDLGLSLLVLAIAGVTVVSVETTQLEKTEVAANPRPAAIEMVSKAEISPTENLQ